MKRLMLLFLGCSLATAAYAEHFRLFGGPGFSRYDAKVSTFYGDYMDPYSRVLEDQFMKSSKPGIFIGGGIEGPLTNYLFIELNALYFSKGCLFDIFHYKKMSYKLNGISIPLLLKAKLLRESSPYLLGGLECSYILAHKSEWHWQVPWSTDPRDQVLYEEDVIEPTSRLDFGLIVGGGFELKIHRVFVFVEARYSFGILNILTGELDSWLESIKTRSECILIGIKI